MEAMLRVHSHLETIRGWDFPGGPVGKTPCSHAGGLGLILGQGTRSRMHAATKKSACRN